MRMLLSVFLAVLLCAPAQAGFIDGTTIFQTNADSMYFPELPRDLWLGDSTVDWLVGFDALPSGIVTGDPSFMLVGGLGGNYPDPGFAAIYHNQPGGVTRMYRRDGHIFSLLSMSLDELAQGQNTFPIEFIGTKSEGEIVREVQWVNPLTQHYEFHGFEGVMTVEWAQGGGGGGSFGHSWGDIVMDFAPVPEPATLALFGLGVGLVAMARRRRKV